MADLSSGARPIKQFSLTPLLAKRPLFISGGHYMHTSNMNGAPNRTAVSTWEKACNLFARARVLEDKSVKLGVLVDDLGMEADARDILRRNYKFPDVFLDIMAGRSIPPKDVLVFFESILRNRSRKDLQLNPFRSRVKSTANGEIFVDECMGADLCERVTLLKSHSTQDDQVPVCASILARWYAELDADFRNVISLWPLSEWPAFEIGHRVAKHLYGTGLSLAQYYFDENGEPVLGYSGYREHEFTDEDLVTSGNEYAHRLDALFREVLDVQSFSDRIVELVFGTDMLDIYRTVCFRTLDYDTRTIYENLEALRLARRAANRIELERFNAELIHQSGSNEITLGEKSGQIKILILRIDRSSMDAQDMVGTIEKLAKAKCLKSDGYVYITLPEDVTETEQNSIVMRLIGDKSPGLEVFTPASTHLSHNELLFRKRL